MVFSGHLNHALTSGTTTPPSFSVVVRDMARSRSPLRTTSGVVLKLAATLLCLVCCVNGQYYQGHFPEVLPEVDSLPPIQPETRGRSSRCYDEQGRPQVGWGSEQWTWFLWGRDTEWHNTSVLPKGTPSVTVVLREDRAINQWVPTFFL